MTETVENAVRSNNAGGCDPMVSVSGVITPPNSPTLVRVVREDSERRWSVIRTGERSKSRGNVAVRSRKMFINGAFGSTKPFLRSSS